MENSYSRPWEMQGQTIRDMQRNAVGSRLYLRHNVQLCVYSGRTDGPMGLTDMCCHQNAGDRDKTGPAGWPCVRRSGKDHPFRGSRCFSSSNN